MVTSILPVILPLDQKRRDQSAPRDLKPPLRTRVSASEESPCLHIWKGIVRNKWLITDLCRSMKALAAAPPWGRLIVSVCTCAHQTLSAAQTVTRRFFFLDLCDSLFVSGATTPGSPGWLHLLMPCVYFSQTRPKDTPGWYRGRTGGEAEGAVVWSRG